MNRACRFSIAVMTLLSSACVSRYWPIGVEEEYPDAGADGPIQSGDAIFFPDAVTELDTGACIPTTCAAQAKNCGTIADGCGGLLDCGTCGQGQLCGIVTHNVCTTLSDLCTPIPRTQACAGKECGVEGDGCGGTYNCGTCAQGEQCGYAEPFKCGVVPPGSTEDCPGKIASCAAVGAQCGTIGNGCGGTINCDMELGGCPMGQFCGLGGPHLCGSMLPVCTPLSPEVACQGKCGIVSNGCGVEVNGGIINCSQLFPCPMGQACGAGGVPNQCGSAQGVCQPLTRAAACGARQCGQASDGCDGSYNCGANNGNCAQGQICRDGVCENICTPTPMALACMGRECGVVGDGCGGTYNCGTCPMGQQCGVLRAFQCDVPPPAQCVPLTMAQACQGKQCGVVFDGCGTGASNQINCGTCSSGTYCGIQQAFQCSPPPAPPPCTPATSCAQLGWACGTAIDQCGNTFNCAAEGRTCAPFQTCTGGISGPTVCQTGSGGGCPLCDAVPSCPANSPTELRGRVITPGQNDANTANQVGVPNAFVYILRTNNLADLPAIPSGVPANGTSCDRCTDQDLGPVLTSAVTDANGEYTLRGNIPIGQEFILVVKAGKFRRAERRTIASGACTTIQLPVTMPNNPTRLPRTMTDGLAVNIPRIAVSTGEIDAIECVFWKMGLQTSVFSRPQLNGRVHLYRANGAWPDQQSADCNACGNSGSMSAQNCRNTYCGGAATSFRTNFLNALNAARITENGGRIHEYDMVVFDCEADANGTTANDPRANVRNYANRGGRMFFSHHTVKWLNTEPSGFGSYNPSNPFFTSFGGAGTYTSSSGLDTGTGRVSFGRPNASPRINNFASWLIREGVTTMAANYTFDIVQPRSRVTAVGSGSEEFVYCDGQDCVDEYVRPQQFSFNTPYGAPATASCGRVAYSGFHVAASGDNTIGASLGSSGVFPNTCQNGGNPRALSAQEKVLLYMLFDLGACTGSEPMPPSCTPRTCPENSCGTIADGCGGTLNCSCSGGNICSGGQCVPPGCTPTTCQAEGASCGLIANGCGGTLNCGVCPICTPIEQSVACMNRCGFVSDGCGAAYNCGGCPDNQACTNGMCMAGTCQRRTACPAGFNCGFVSDGCDGLLHCGDCTAPEACGGGGLPNVCGAPACMPQTCAAVGAECGLIGNGCGGTVNCGMCPPGQTCGIVNGEPNKCFGCQPRTCAQAGAQCGAIGDGCGGIVECGNCPMGQICGATQPNQCGVGMMCTPQTCAAVGAECGLIGNGCGGTVNCGECPPGELCGIETPFKCDPPPACVPRTCAEAGAQCGAIGDGCGGVVDCGTCPVGYSCGTLAPNQCYTFE